MSDLNLLGILENIDKLDAAASNEFLRSLCKQAAKEITELNALRLRRGTQEPVAWVCEGFGKAKRAIDYIQKEVDVLPLGTMLYTVPPQREWQGLTGEEIIIMSRYNLEYAALIGEVQGKLKEKNT
jgi:hypothetical protein